MIFGFIGSPSVGDISIEDVGNGIISNDRPGDIQLNKIEDRSGDIVVKDLRGNVTISDRSCDILFKHTLSDLSIDD